MYGNKQKSSSAHTSSVLFLDAFSEVCVTFVLGEAGCDDKAVEVGDVCFEKGVSG